MMHILAVTIFLGALALSLATIGWMIAANRVKIMVALLGASRIEPSPVAPAYAPRNRRFRVNYVNLLTTAPVTQRLAA